MGGSLLLIVALIGGTFAMALSQPWVCPANLRLQQPGWPPADYRRTPRAAAQRLVV